MPRRPWLWWLIGLVAVLLLIDGLLAVVRLRSAAGRLPDRGAVVERLPGLHGEVEARLDGEGVPHVKATEEWDLWFAQGYLQARDRFLQMEIARRSAVGTLAALLGRDALPFDIRVRTVRVEATARRQLGQLAQSDLRALEAFAAGVNAALDRFGSWIAPEVWLLGVEPERWRPADSLSILVLFQLRVSSASAAELERAVQLGRLGRARALDLWGWSQREGDAWIPPVRYNNLLPSQAADVISPAGAKLASSAWAVAPARTASGRPLLAAQLEWTPELPAPWHLVDLRTPELHVAGAALAGVPAVLVGHTEEVAWALTPALLDDEDLYALTVDGARNRQLVDGAWHPLPTVTESIAVRGDDGPELIKVRLSERGPVVRDTAREVLALSWTGHSGPSPVAAILAMARAGSVAAVASAWDGVVGPPLHLVAADISGRIMDQVVGLAPDRGLGAGRLPAPGNDSRWAWRGFLPMAANPQSIDPAVGFVAAAGQDPFTEGDAPSSQALPGEFASPWRVRRVRARLGASRSWDVAATLELQGDLVSLQARTALTLLRPDLQRHGGRSARELLGWDGRMAAEAVPAHVYARLLLELGRELGGDEALRAGLEGSPFGPEEILRILAGGMDEAWWNDVRTPATEGREAIIRRALDRIDQVGQLEAWGEVHQVELEHPLAQLVVVGPLCRRLWSRGPFHAGGDAATVCGFDWDPWRPFRVSLIPALRFVIDVGSWDDMVVALPPGESGQPWSPHAADQLAPWLRGSAVPLGFTADVVERATHASMLLLPAQGQ